MLDTYLQGVAERLSVEAPVAVVKEQSRRYVLGGAANVAANVRALGGQVFLYGVVGSDRAGAVISELCRESGIVPRFVIDRVKPTTEKTRVMVAHHQMLRLDVEDDGAMRPAVERELIRKLGALRRADILIFSDYLKGAVTEGVIRTAVQKFGADRIIADFKPAHRLFYRGIRAVLPNVREAYGLTGIEGATAPLAQKVARELFREFSSSVVLKRGERGMAVLEARGRKILHIPARAREVFDVTGAGDTVIAALGLALACGASLRQAAEIANHAAGLAVEKEGTAVVTRTELIRRLKNGRIS